MKKKITLIVVAVLLTISLIVGISYAYWRHTFVATNVNKIVSSCFNMEITNEKNSITLDDAYPITDEKGKSLTPYSFTITNTCDLFASYTINLEMLEGTTLNSKYIKTMINNEAITNLNALENTDPSIEGATESRILFKGSLGSGDSTDYTFRVWMDYDTPNNEDSMNKSFQGKITITAEVSTYSPVENGFTNLAEALLVNEYQTTNVNVAKNKISSKQDVDTSKTAPIIIWKEQIVETTTQVSARKPDISLVGMYGVSNNSTKVLLGDSYTFDETSGYYTLVNQKYYDPETVDFSMKDYYFVMGGMSVGGSDNINSSNRNYGATIYKVKKLAEIKKEDVELSSGTLVPTNLYIFDVISLNETELESDKSDKGLYKAVDDYGDSYYYRGNVTNNYVKFAGFYWKIIRINGDGSIRLIFNGTNPDKTGSSITIGSYVYNNVKTNPTYVGYMYSNTLNTSYADTIRNDNNSVVKTKLDNWYKTNIFDKGYSEYIADSGFCNDRSIAPDSVGNGYSIQDGTYYNGRYRFYNYNPSFICPNKSSDLFTLNGNSFGNQSLTYPIGMITIDEVMYAGYVKGYLNKMSYLYSTSAFWTMTPANYRVEDISAIIWYVNSTGAITDSYANSAKYIRPVINLKSTTEITGGIGTKNDPFIIK